MVSKRRATHAGSWYSQRATTLSAELDGWLGAVPASSGHYDKLPVAKARVVIAPHAGYSYSGPTAAWAYRTWDVSRAKRVFLLGPSHHYYLENCALSSFAYYSTPLGDLRLDDETIAKLRQTGKFARMTEKRDEDEHSLEMHLPYIYKALSAEFGADPASFPPLVPILVGNTSPTAEREFGEVLAPYLEDEGNAFVVSSDFAHWGLRFGYMQYLTDLADASSGVALHNGDRAPISNPRIYESIGALDAAVMRSIATGSHAEYVECLATTGNTVCGRHPIGVVMAGVEQLVRGGRLDRAASAFRFVQYARSSDCVKVTDSSVSYVSGFAVLDTHTDDAGAAAAAAAAEEEEEEGGGLAAESMDTDLKGQGTGDESSEPEPK